MVACRQLDGLFHCALLARALLSFAVPGAAQAQQMGTSSASFNAGYRRTAGEENRPVDFSLRDPNGDMTINDGVMNTSPDQSTLVGSTIDAIGNFTDVGGIYTASLKADNRQANLANVSASTHTTISGPSRNAISTSAAVGNNASYSVSAPISATTQ